MRLIDADELLKVLNKRLADYSCDSNSGAQRIADIYKHELIPVVKNAPTAFDKEKVKLEISSIPHGYYNVETENEIIEIIEKGGME